MFINSIKAPFKVTFLIIVAVFQSSAALASGTKSSLNLFLDTPDWLNISGAHRARFETLNRQFRSGGSGSDQILLFRTNLSLQLTWNQWKIVSEVMDSRQARGDEDTKISSGDVNPLDLLQLYAEWNFAGDERSESSLRAGRFTMDLGSRRLVARNRFRNTINAFTGVDWQRKKHNGEQLRLFYTLPVSRQPSTFDRLLDNYMQSDDQAFESAFWGIYYKLPKSALQVLQSEGEFFYFGLDESDTHNRPTRNRDIYTVGGRIYKEQIKRQYDYQVEFAYQFGKSNASADESDLDKLDHRAIFARAEVGYSFGAKWAPRLVGQLDYASGDDDNNDGNNNRFDTLFGARRGDFGPTSIYGPFIRANIISPGIRLQLKPTPKVSIFFAHRAYWLASKKDAWVVAHVNDPTGSSGSYLGQQLEGRLRWDVVPDNVLWEIGAAYYDKAGFAEDAPNANVQGNATYVYSQLILMF